MFRRAALLLAAFALFALPLATPAAAQFKPPKFPNPFGGRSGKGSVQGLLAAAEKEVRNEITRQVGKQLGVDAPITLDQRTAFPKENDLADFHPQAWTPQTLADLDKPLLPGDYAIPVAAFCTQYSIHVAGNGTPYKLAPLQGRQAAVLSRVLTRGTLKGIPHDKLQYINMRIQAGVPFSQWYTDYQDIVRKVDPEDEKALEGDALADIQKIYADHNRNPLFKLPPLDTLLRDMGEPGQYVLGLERARKILTDKTQNAEKEPSLLYEPQGDGLPMILPPLKNAPPAPWSLVKPGIYARFTNQEGWPGKNLLEFRITPAAITPVPDNAAAPRILPVAFEQGAFTADGLPLGKPLQFSTVNSILGLAKPYVIGVIESTAGRIAIRVLAVAAGVAEAPEIGTLLIGYTILKGCQALILMAEAPNDGGGGDAEADEKIRRAFEKQEKENGRDSLEKSLKTISERLREHEQKLAELKQNGGFTSSVEREIRTFQRQIKILKQMLGI